MRIDSQTSVGLVGLGNMGSGVAENLLKHGFGVVVHERSERVRRWAEGRTGVRVTPSLAELAALTDVVLLIVPDHQAVNEVLYGPGAVIAGIRRGSLVIDMTTGDPVAAVANHRRLARRGIRMLEAPMTGGATGAREGTLLLMVGGDEDLCRRCQPLFGAIARKVVYAGGPGRGQSMKLLQNQLGFTLFFATCEALWVGRTLGFDESVLIDVFQNSNARNYETEVRFPRFILTKSFQSGARVKIAEKDARLVTELEQRAGIALPLATTVHRYLLAAMRRFGGDADLSRGYQLVGGKRELKRLSAVVNAARGGAARERAATGAKTSGAAAGGATRRRGWRKKSS